ncbi:MAG TPA: ABC transporter permease [Magnetospirillaceae bacterium]|jgi:peptide/nickel transport system permease protein
MSAAPALLLSRSAFGRLTNHGPALIGLVLLVLLVIAAASAPLIEHAFGIDATSIDLLAMLSGPSAAHPLGTDEVGRDLLSRLLRGGQVSLGVGLLTALVAAAIGTVIGVAAGYRGGLLDAVLMRFTDGIIALPLLPLLIVLGALDPAKLGLNPDIFKSNFAALARIVIIIALVGWTTVARLVRAATLTIRVQDYVRSAEAMGAPPLRVMVRHILPNVVSPLIVATTLSVGNIILLESALSFLGLGVQPPIPSWGNMLTAALEQMSSNPSLAMWPGVMIFVTVLAFNLVGDGLQDALDPRGTRRN